MNPILKNIIAVIVGVFVGGAVNMGIIMISGSIIPPPAGIDVSNTKVLIKNIHLFEPKHFIMPFLAHSMGAFVGAFLAAIIAFNHKMKFAIGLGIWTLIGGIAAVYMIPAPLWYDIVDLSLAYIPMAYLAGKLGMKYSFNK